MRTLIVTESFLPSINGVTRSVLQVGEHLVEGGHEVEVVAAAPARHEGPVPAGACGFPVTYLPSLPLPGYPALRVAAPGVARLQRLLADRRPDVVHLAAPFVLGWDAVRAARRQGCPTVAVFQTDLPGYATRYGLPALEALAWRRIGDLHGLADRTLAPSSWSAGQLERYGVPRVHHWARGVDATTFHPSRRSAELRAGWGVQEGEVAVGYVGRLAVEKQVEDLRALVGLPGVRVVVVGDGPHRARLEALLPTAHFTGWQSGGQLAAAVASLDLMVHPGELDTFGQTLQEAMASGVPVVAVAAGGPLDLVDDGRSGLLYPPGRLDVLRRQVADLAGRDGQRVLLGRAGRRQVEHRDWRRATALLVDHYEQVVRAPAPLAA